MSQRTGSAIAVGLLLSTFLINRFQNVYKIIIAKMPAQKFIDSNVPRGKNDVNLVLTLHRGIINTSV